MAFRKWFLAACSWLLLTTSLHAATYRSDNFIVHAQTSSLAKQVADRAEKQRDTLAEYWIGETLPDWWRPCTITVKHGPTSGFTQFSFHNREVFGWNMEVRGNNQSLAMDSLPHELSHTVFATVFRRPLPRWADEGACQTIESDASRKKMRNVLRMNWQHRYGLKQLFPIKNYPRDGKKLATLYSQSHSVVEYLIAMEGPATFLSFMEDAHRRNWDAATQSHYGFRSVLDMESAWLKWLESGMPTPKSRTNHFLAYRMTPDGPKTYIRPQTPKTQQNATHGEIYVFTSPGCEPCERLKTHYSAGKFGQKQFRFVSMSNTAARRAFENSTGQRLRSAPTVWVYGTRQYQTGYNGYYPGLLQWITTALVGSPPFGWPDQGRRSGMTLQDVQNYLVSNGYIRRSDVDAYLKREDVQRFITEQGLLTIDQFESVKQSLATKSDVEQSAEKAVEVATEKSDFKTKLLETALKAVDDKVKLNDVELDDAVKLEELPKLILGLLHGDNTIRDVLAELVRSGVIKIIDDRIKLPDGLDDIIDADELAKRFDDHVAKSDGVKSVVAGIVKQHAIGAVAEKTGFGGTAALLTGLGVSGPLALALPIAARLARRRVRRKFDQSGNVIEENEE